MHEVYKELKSRGASRREILERLGNIEGLYVPSLYSVSYNKDSTIAEFKPVADVPSRIKRQVVTNLSETFYPRKPLVPYMKAIQDRAVLEIQRGCIRGCRFCQAGMIYRPIRERSLEVLKENIIDIINSTGYDEITLSSLSTSDYTRLGELLEYLIAEMGERKVNISLPSLRIDAFSLDIMNKVQDVKKSSLTFAPEGGTQRMRNVINKGLTQEQILEGAAEAFKGGWNKVKLYFMLGQPTETDEDVKGIPILANEIAKTYYDTVPKEQRQGKVAITISTSYFVPKPFTPFQWVGQIAPDEYLRRKSVLNETLKQQLNAKSIKYNWHDSATSYLEGLLARGDRRVGRVVYEAYKQGCIFDAWTDFFEMSKWEKAIELAGIDPDFYTLRERSRDEILPWDFIDTGISKKFLLREWDNALKEKVTENCREGCAGCGCSGWQTGVCVEARG